MLLYSDTLIRASKFLLVLDRDSDRMKKLAVLLAVVVVFLVWEFRKQRATIAEQQEQLTDLKARLETRSKVSSLDLQEKCARQAYEQFRQSGWDKEPTAGFSNHYDETLNKCFVLIENTDAKTAPGTIWTNKTLVDAFEGKVFGTYSWHTVKNKKYWEVPPFECKAALPSGEEKICKSPAEFDELIKPYMGESQTLR